MKYVLDIDMCPICENESLYVAEHKTKYCKIKSNKLQLLGHFLVNDKYYGFNGEKFAIVTCPLINIFEIMEFHNDGLYYSIYTSENMILSFDNQIKIFKSGKFDEKIKKYILLS